MTTCMSEAAPVPGADESSKQSSFQLQTTSIRNSVPFKNKSADIFGSLESIERDYNSAVSGRGLGTDGEGGDYHKEADEEEGRLEGCIKRGCIFRKPSVSPSGMADSSSKRGSGMSDSDRQRALEDTETGLSSTRSPGSIRSESEKRIKSTASQSNRGDSSRTDRAGFRKPTPLRSRDTKGYGSSRSRYRSDSSFTRRGRVHHQRTADHVLNPQKYTKYSLEETNMCGNAANRSVALGFLSELRKRNANDQEDQASGEAGAKDQVIFKKPVASTATEEGSIHQPTKKLAYGSVYKMPEYEVGNAPGPRSKKPKLTFSASDEGDQGKPVFSLDHLQNEQGTDSHNKDAVDTDQSETSKTGGNGEADQSDHGGTVQSQGIGFMNRKGKRRQIRKRQEEDISDEV